MGDCWTRLFAVCLLAAGVCQGQESLRMSLASAEAAEARRKTASTLDGSNLRLGPTAWSFTAGFGMDADDNIGLDSVNPKSDVIFRPEIGTRMIFPLSEVNSLNLSLGAGYSAYLHYSEFDRFYITPGSEVAFDLYAGDFWFNFHDRFSILEDTYQDPTVVGSANYSRLENAAGLGATWDLNEMKLRAGFDHVNYIALQGTTPTAGQPDGQSEVFSSSAGYRLRPGMLGGVEGGGTLIHYDQTSGSQLFSDASEVSVGGFLDATLSEYLHARGSAGYLVFSPEQSAQLTNTDNLSGLYAQVDITHRLNQYVSYSLSGGRSLNFTFYSGTVELYFVRWQANWNVLRQWTLGTSFQYENGTQFAVDMEKFDRYGPGLSLGRPITAKLSGNLAYLYYWRGSDLPNRSYTVNALTLQLVYRF